MRAAPGRSWAVAVCVAVEYVVIFYHYIDRTCRRVHAGLTRCCSASSADGVGCAPLALHVASFMCENLLARMRAVEVAPSSPLVPKSTSKRAQSGPMSAACHMDDVPCRKSGVDGHRSSARIIGWRQELCWRRGRLRRRVTQSHRNHRRRTGVVVWYMCAPRGVKAGVFACILGRLSVYLFCLCV